MNLFLKQFLVISFVFLIILLFQNLEDKKQNRARNTFYEKFKLPLLISSITGLIINLPGLFSDNGSEQVVESVGIAIIAPIQPEIPSNSEMSKAFVPNNNFGSNVEPNKLSWYPGKELSELDINTALPDF
jgi:hypothetical protein